MPIDPEALMDEVAAAGFLALSTRTLQRMRAEGGGPPFVRLGERRVAYRHSDLVVWTNARRFSSTAEEAARQRQAVRP